jgi:3-oxoisoapionate decarboxylase
MQLGIGTYTYGWSSGAFRSDPAQRSDSTFLSAQDLIDRAVRLDVPLVQICVIPDLAAMDDADLSALRTYSQTNGKALEIGTIGSDPDHLRRFLHIAQILGARLVRTIFTDASPGLVAEHKSIAKVVDQFAAAQVHLAVENYETTSFLYWSATC